MSIESNLNRLRDQVAAACARSHRDAASVCLMAVSKTQPASALVEAYLAGQRLFGENRVQEWQTKRQTLDRIFSPDDPARTHLIGPLQNNKTARAAEIFDAVDTLDSLKTAQRLHDASTGRPLKVCVEVKLSHEETKHGILPEHLPALLSELAVLTNLRVVGLMTVPPFDADPETARPCFQKLRKLRDENLVLCPTLTGLSMGMSNDFAIAIEEGSTMVRIGTAIFGDRS